MRLLLASIAFALTTLLIAPAVNADSGSAARRIWLEQIASKLEAEGFELGAMRRDNELGYTIEVRYRDASNMRAAKVTKDGEHVRTAR